MQKIRRIENQIFLQINLGLSFILRLSDFLNNKFEYMDC